jgi:hypothetical protein
MKVDFSHITSPLTVIALFAAVVEASAIASLPFLDTQSQMIYTWFLVGFPPFLTLLFFITLNFNSESLFPRTSAPSDNPAFAVQTASSTAGQSSTEVVRPNGTSFLSEVAGTEALLGNSDPLLILVADPQAQQLMETSLSDHLTILSRRYALNARFIARDRHSVAQAVLASLAQGTPDQQKPPARAEGSGDTG